MKFPNNIYWCLQTISQENGAALTNCSRATVDSIYQILRYVAKETNKKTKNKLGGYGRIVELRKSLDIGYVRDTN